MLNSIPTSGQFGEGPEDYPVDWTRYPSGDRPVDDEEMPFNRPGDVRSIPRDGRTKDEDSPETLWSRNPNHRIPGVPDEDIPFDKPGQLNSIPTSRQPGEGGPEDRPIDWTRFPGGAKPDDIDEDMPFN